MGTHQELEMFGSQPAYPEKLLHKKESLQNQLINIRVELSQATTVIGEQGLWLLTSPSYCSDLDISQDSRGRVLQGRSYCRRHARMASLPTCSFYGASSQRARRSSPTGCI